MTEPSRLSLDISVPAKALIRRGAIAACSSTSDQHNSSSSSVSAAHDQRRGGISVHRDEELMAPVIRVLEPSQGREGVGRNSPDWDLRRVPCKSLARWERALLEDLDTGPSRRRSTGPFLTLHWRRKRKRIASETETRHDRSLIDDIYHGQTEMHLSLLDRWEYNTFLLDFVTGGRSLPVLLVHLFKLYGLIESFQLDVVKVWKCLIMIEEGYHSNNPYHNAVHAADVTQAMHCFLREKRIQENLTPLEIMTSLLAAVTHDLDHPGVNQPFLIATSNHLASLYKNSSVLENHHWRSAIGCLVQSEVFSHLEKKVWEDIGFQIRSLILATDITRQQEFLARFRNYMESHTLDLQMENYRHFVLQIALKCADICNPCRPWAISSKWSLRICEEFFRQGDFEKQLNLPVTAMCDRKCTTIAKIQAGFFRFVVAPLFEEWNNFLQTPLSNSLLHHLRKNQCKWEKLVSDEDLDLAKSVLVGGSQIPAIVSKEDNEEEEDRKEEQRRALERTVTAALSRVDHLNRRRHSVPLSVPRMLPYTAVRTEAVVPMAASAGNLQRDTRITALGGDPARLSLMFSSSESQSLSDVTKRSLFKQFTYPPAGSAPRLLRQVAVSELVKSSEEHEQEQEQESTVEGQKKECKNGCGTPEATDSDVEVGPRSPQWLCNAKLQNSIEGAVRHRRASVALDIGVARDSYFCSADQGEVESEEEDEKENADPAVLAFLMLKNNKSAASGIYVKGRPQALNRLSHRRCSAPVGMLKEEVFALGMRAGGCGAEMRRRDSLPVDLGLSEALDSPHEERHVCQGTPRRSSLPFEPTTQKTLEDGDRRGRVSICRRFSMPPDVPASGDDVIFPRANNSNGNHRRGNSPSSWGRAVLVRQAWSFDAAFLDPGELWPLVAVSSGNSIVDVKRRGSVPVEVCLLGHSGR